MRKQLHWKWWPPLKGAGMGQAELSESCLGCTPPQLQQQTHADFLFILYPLGRGTRENSWDVLN